MTLRSMILAKRFWYDWAGNSPEDRRDFKRMVDFVECGLRDRKTALVNAQSVWDDISPFTDDGLFMRDKWMEVCAFRKVPRPMPPYRSMWLEAHASRAGQRCGEHDGALTGQRVGCLTVRRDRAEVTQKLKAYPESLREILLEEHVSTVIEALWFHDYRGCAICTGNFIGCLDGAAAVLECYRQYTDFVLEPGETREQAQETRKPSMLLREGWLLHSLARMNCANAELTPIPGQWRPRKKGPQAPPFSLWHEIKITSGPKLRRAAAASGESGEASHVRFHWVRGHYADYTKGAGLFGNPKLKAVFWIPEHRAGDEELGAVAQSYRIE